MKMLNKIWLFLNELYKALFDLNLKDYSRDNDLVKDDSENKIKPVKVIKKSLSGNNDMVIHYTAGDNHQKETIEKLKDKDWKWNSFSN